MPRINPQKAIEKIFSLEEKCMDLEEENKYLRRLLKEAYGSPQGVVGDLADRIEEILAGGGGE